MNSEPPTDRYGGLMVITAVGLYIVSYLRSLQLKRDLEIDTSRKPEIKEIKGKAGEDAPPAPRGDPGSDGILITTYPELESLQNKLVEKWVKRRQTRQRIIYLLVGMALCSFANLFIWRLQQNQQSNMYVLLIGILVLLLFLYFNFNQYFPDEKKPSSTDGDTGKASAAPTQDLIPICKSKCWKQYTENTGLAGLKDCPSANQDNCAPCCILYRLLNGYDPVAIANFFFSNLDLKKYIVSPTNLTDKSLKDAKNKISLTLHPDKFGLTLKSLKDKGILGKYFDPAEIPLVDSEAPALLVYVTSFLDDEEKRKAYIEARKQIKGDLPPLDRSVQTLLQHYLNVLRPSSGLVVIGPDGELSPVGPTGSTGPTGSSGQ